MYPITYPPIYPPTQDNERAAVTFSTTGTIAAFTPHSAGWASYTKADRGDVDGGAGGAGGSPIAGHAAAAAAAAAAERGAPLSWLLQPGFVLRYLEVSLTLP